MEKAAHASEIIPSNYFQCRKPINFHCLETHKNKIYQAVDSKVNRLACKLVINKAQGRWGRFNMLNINGLNSISFLYVKCNIVN